MLSDLVQCGVVAGVAALITSLIHRQRRSEPREPEQSAELQKQLQHMTELRLAERAGRIRAEQALRTAAVAASAADTTPGDGGTGAQQEDGTPSAAASTSGRAAAFSFRPIGYVKSCFSQRNGTPRQPLLVPAARCMVQLEPDVPLMCMDGLTQYSHCWVLYVFHANTDINKVIGPDSLSGQRQIKSKIHVPRLEGGQMGVLATRSPHRPVPIGLSVAKVVGVEGNCLILGGADIIDGSPILDIKPYVPFCDGVPGASAPSWVQAEAANEPLHVEHVCMSEAAAASITQAWQRRCGRRPLYPSADDFLELVQQVLARDIRSVHQRLKGPSPASLAVAAAARTGSSAAAAGGTQAPAGAAGQGDAAGGGFYHVVLDGVDIAYDVDGAGNVLVSGGTPTARHETS